MPSISLGEAHWTCPLTNHRERSTPSDMSCMSHTLCRPLSRHPRLLGLGRYLLGTPPRLARADGPPQFIPPVTRRLPPCSAERRKPRVSRKQVARVGDTLVGGDQGSKSVHVQTLPRPDVIIPASQKHPVPAPLLSRTLTSLQSQTLAYPPAQQHTAAKHLNNEASTSAQERGEEELAASHRETLQEEDSAPPGDIEEDASSRTEEPGHGAEESQAEEEQGGGPNAPSVMPLYRIPSGLLSSGKISKIRSSEFVKSSADVTQCPQDGLPEVAVIGRSNVGKSSLINMLTHRRELAQTSKKPGKTQLINHFIINGNWYLVDLPGYGYAKAPTAVRTEWHGFTQKYFLSRPNLVTVLLLVDASIPPLQVDLDCVDWLGQNKIPVTVVFTKCDRKKKKKNGGRPPAENVADFEHRLSEYYEELPPWIMTSSVVSLGKDTLLAHIAQVIEHWKS